MLYAPSMERMVFCTHLRDCFDSWVLNTLCMEVLDHTIDLSVNMFLLRWNGIYDQPRSRCVAIILSSIKAQQPSPTLCSALLALSLISSNTLCRSTKRNSISRNQMDHSTNPSPCLEANAGKRVVVYLDDTVSPSLMNQDRH